MKSEILIPTKIRHFECFVTKNPELSNESIWNFGTSANQNQQQGGQLEFSETLTFPGSGRVLGPPDR